jgi:Tol biopolymer transport system component
MKKYLGASKFLMLLVIIAVFMRCKDKATGPVIGGNYAVCYEKLSNGRWQIFTNNIAGTAPHNISNCPGDAEYPQWSPDGRYIVYSHRQAVVVYDTKTRANAILTDDSIDAGLEPGWTPDGKILYFARNRYDVHDSGAMYVMNVNGGQKKKILNLGAQIYFYNDSYNFLYVVDYTKVYIGNVNSTAGEFLFDISEVLNQQVVVQGFNPLTEELLITPTATDGKRSIATYGVRTRGLSILLTAEEGYTFFQVKYSKDFRKIAFVEHSGNDEYLSVLENGVKKRLLRIPKTTPPVYFSYDPMEFSPDGKYIAFSEQIFHTGQWVTFSTPLFITDVTNATVWRIEEEAHGPSWNPRP